MNLSSSEANERERLAYEVGALLYCPAINGGIAPFITEGRLGGKFSLALCLEDTISESAVPEAEKQIVRTIMEIYSHKNENPAFTLPKIFIRVREPSQVCSMFDMVYGCREILTGFVFPKYSPVSAESYNAALLRINGESDKRIYMMPIMESPDMIDLNTRKKSLLETKRHIDSIKDYVLNIRVGGNDFCKFFGVRRRGDETIYEILPVCGVLCDIITVFSGEYVVSGPVWEYFSGSQWEAGLRREMKQDKLNGFVGKTVIHPRQIPVANESMKVDVRDLEDAYDVIRRADNLLLVGKGPSGERMNEVLTHLKWAKKTVALAEIYGVL